jgi:hypothetical protein
METARKKKGETYKEQGARSREREEIKFLNFSIPQSAISRQYCTTL